MKRCTCISIADGKCLLKALLFPFVPHNGFSNRCILKQGIDVCEQQFWWSYTRNGAECGWLQSASFDQQGTEDVHWKYGICQVSSLLFMNS